MQSPISFQAVVKQMSCSCHAVVRQFSGSCQRSCQRSCQAVVRKLSGGCVAGFYSCLEESLADIQYLFDRCLVVIRQLFKSHSVAVQQSSGSCQLVVRLSLSNQIDVRFVKYCAAFRTERLFSLVFILYEFQGRMGSRSAFKGGNPKIRGFELEQFQKVALICTIRIQLKFENRFMIRLQDM